MRSLILGIYCEQVLSRRSANNGRSVVEWKTPEHGKCAGSGPIVNSADRWVCDCPCHAQHVGGDE